jgi:hypothetical protein
LHSIIVESSFFFLVEQNHVLKIKNKKEEEKRKKVATCTFLSHFLPKSDFVGLERKLSCPTNFQSSFLPNKMVEKTHFSFHFSLQINQPLVIKILK